MIFITDCVLISLKFPPLSTRIKEKPSELDDLLDFTIQTMTGTRSEKLILKVKRIIDRRLGKNYQWPGNVRELEQCVKSVLLRRDYKGKQKDEKGAISLNHELLQGISDRTITVPSLVAGYCKLLYDKVGTYEKVAKLTGLDRRTIKKHIMNYKKV